mgnify:CR=1 FL=1
MKKTNSNIISLININSPINTSSENAEKTKNPDSSAPDTPNTTPPNEKTDDKQQNAHAPFPYDDACASLLAYSICQDSWRFALQNERQKAKYWTSIFKVIFLLLITAILLFKLCESINWLFITIAVIGGITLLGALVYYIFECIYRKQWFKYNTDMLIQLSKPEINLIECSPKSRERMTNFINQYRYDKWMEEKKKKKTTCGFIQKIKGLLPFSIS